jgi:hypothetical protein
MHAILSRAARYGTGGAAAMLALLIMIWIATAGNPPA